MMKVVLASSEANHSRCRTSLSIQLGIPNGIPVSGQQLILHTLLQLFPDVFNPINNASLRTTDLPMERNKAFRPEYEPFRYTDTIRPDQGKIYGPVSFLNSTQAHFIAQHMEQPEAQVSTCEHCYKWTARNNRKGRHALLSSRYDKISRGMPPPTNGFKQVVKGIWRMFTFFPVWSVHTAMLRDSPVR
jgi:hypothetical protein